MNDKREKRVIKRLIKFNNGIIPLLNLSCIGKVNLKWLFRF